MTEGTYAHQYACRWMKTLVSYLHPQFQCLLRQGGTPSHVALSRCEHTRHPRHGCVCFHFPALLVSVRYRRAPGIANSLNVVLIQKIGVARLMGNNFLKKFHWHGGDGPRHHSTFDIADRRSTRCDKDYFAQLLTLAG